MKIESLSKENEIQLKSMRTRIMNLEIEKNELLEKIEELEKKIEELDEIEKIFDKSPKKRTEKLKKGFVGNNYSLNTKNTPQKVESWMNKLNFIF